MFCISHSATISTQPKAQQSILVCQHEAPDALAQDQFEKMMQAFLAVIQARAEIGDDFVPPTFDSAKSLQQFLLTNQIVLLIVAGNAGVARSSA